VVLPDERNDGWQQIDRKGTDRQQAVEKDPN
jgi:hypothetical protein